MVSKKAYELLVQTIAERTGAAADTIGPDTRIADDLGLDSLNAIEILADVTRQLDVVVDEEDLIGVDTVGGLAALLSGDG